MAKTYKGIKQVEIGAGAGGANPPYELTFTTSTWNASGSDWEIQVAESLHNQGTKIIIQVQELVGSDYKAVETAYDIDGSGNLTILIGNDSRFDGRVLIYGE